MLYALRYPFSFAVLVVTFVLAMFVRGGVQRLISGRRQPAWVRANTKRRRSTWLKPYVDPYGLIAVLLGGVGWGIAVETGDPRSRSRGRHVLQLIAGPLVLAGVGIGLLAIFRAVAVRGQRPSLVSVMSGYAYAKPARACRTSRPPVVVAATHSLPAAVRPGCPLLGRGRVRRAWRHRDHAGAATGRGQAAPSPRAAQRLLAEGQVPP